MSDTTAHLHWGAEALWAQLVPLLPGLTVEVLGQVDSTNTRLIERARAAGGDPDAPITRPGGLDAGVEPPPTPHGRRAGDMEPCLLVAEHQTRGRGRLGRDWQASPVASLTFSLALPLAPVDWSGLSLAVGLALAEALDPLPPGADPLATPPRIGLKWPNDLWVIDAPGEGRKLGGILIETVSVGRRRMCVVGVGLNVMPQALEGLSSGYASLHELHPGLDAPAALARVAAPLVRALKRFERQGFAECVAAYARRDLLAGHPVLTSAGSALEGIAAGVDASGALLLDVDGQRLRIVSGEASVRLRTMPRDAAAAARGPASGRPA